MQGQLKKKEEEQLILEAKKKQAPVHATLTTEGPMKLKDESRKVEDAGRSSFEHSVRVELDAIKKRLLSRKKKKGQEEKKKPRYGWKLADGDGPLGDDDDKDDEGEEDDSGEKEK